ncbi:MAG: hypothetical protein AAF635_03655 [Cyanobacteria bacterium P01_C01_bin.69]
MTSLMEKALQKVQDLPAHLQDEIAERLIEDIENEIGWQKTLSQPISPILEAMAAKALENAKSGKSKLMGFDEL